MSDALDKLGALSGLGRQTMLEIAEQVKANHARLNGCARHEFALIPGGAPLRQKYRCTLCGGEVDHHAWYWHEQGRR